MNWEYRYWHNYCLFCLVTKTILYPYSFCEMRKNKRIKGYDFKKIFNPGRYVMKNKQNVVLIIALALLYVIVFSLSHAVAADDTTVNVAIVSDPESVIPFEWRSPAELPLFPSVYLLLF